MKKTVLITLFLFYCIGTAFSQFDAQFSQYMFHTSSFNPAAVGQNEMINVIFQHRLQWLGLKDSTNNMNDLQSNNISINTPLKIGSKYHGVGIRYLSDKTGLFSNESAYLQYAYTFGAKTSSLSVGMEIGFVSVGFDGDNINTIPIGEYHDMKNDPEIQQTTTSGMGMDISIGAIYKTPKIYGGLSYSHLNSPVINWGERIQFRPTSTLYLTGGYNWIVPETKYIIKPSTLIKTDFKSLQLDVSALAIYNDKLWGGVSYRMQDALVLLAGLNISGGLSLGYSYDLPTSQMITVSTGSHEIILIYNFEYVFGKKNNKYKSIRIL